MNPGVEAGGGSPRRKGKTGMGLRNLPWERLRRNPLATMSGVLLLVALATLISVVFWICGFSEIIIVLIYILSVLLAARMTGGCRYGIIASVLGVICFDFFFTEPYQSLYVSDEGYLAAFAVMLFACIVASILMSRAVRSSEEASAREKQLAMLYRITSLLAKAANRDDVATISVQSLSNLLDCDVIFLMAGRDGNFCREYKIRRGERKVCISGLEQGGERSVIEASYILPVANRTYRYGLICLPKNSIARNSWQENLLSSITAHIFTAMERESLALERERAKNEIEREKFKTNLLRSISHDLRTPLAGIAGAAEMLNCSMVDEEARKLAQGIYKDANWLTQMVENILSLTKIQEGQLLAGTQTEAVEEVVAESVGRAAKYARGRRIETDIPKEILLVPMDGKLIEQVLMNLIDNAVKHTPPDGRILVSVRPEADRVWFLVSDDGTGVKSEDLPKIFNLFYKGGEARSDSARGIGLGLAICKTIVEAHGGEICAENNAGRGMTARFYLPREGASGFGKQQ